MALRIADQLADRAIRAPSDGSATWIGPQFLPQLNRYQLQPVGFDLHSGGCGIALMLATVAQVTGAAEHAELARAAIEPLRRAIDGEPETLADELGFGAASGIGGIVYGLTRLALLLDEPALLADAGAVAALLTRERIAHAPTDAFSGLAGEMLGQLTLYEATRDQIVLERVAACGHRLLEARSPAPDGRLGWITFKDRMLTGLSHGTAGIAYALLRLYDVTGDETLRDAAEEAIAVEDAVFDVSEGNWPDLREDEQPAFKTNWCHGAPGIGLARVGAMKALDIEHVRQDVDAAIATTLKVEMGDADHVCCGNLGRTELLLVAGTRQRRPDLIEAARRRVQAVASRAEAEGGFWLHEYLPRAIYAPGFFMGMAGIGYQLLRVARPDAVPSVLLWE
jgi:type 2 lantibiotic biosynthesis protein LanM